MLLAMRALLLLFVLGGCEKRPAPPPTFTQRLSCVLTAPSEWKVSPAPMPDHLVEALEWPDGKNPTGQSIVVKDEGERGVSGMVEVLERRTKDSLGGQPNFAVLEKVTSPAGVLLWFAWGEPVRNDGYFVSQQHGRTVVAWSTSLEPAKREAVSRALSTVVCAKRDVP